MVRQYTHKGITLNASKWAIKLGITVTSFRDRIKNHGETDIVFMSVMPKNIIEKHTHNCKRCGKTFNHKSNSKNLFCSRECAFIYKASCKKIKALDQTKTSKNKIIKKCRNCSKDFETHNNNVVYCSKECIKESTAKLAKKYCLNEIRKCSVCGKEYKANNHFRSFCSDKCREIKKSEVKKKTRRKDRGNVHSHRKRVRKYGGSYEAGISLKKLRERDGDKCLICGQKVLHNNVSGYHKRNATIGHIIALSNGGGHVMSNIQLECHQCNTIKGSRDGGQLRLI